MSQTSKKVQKVILDLGEPSGPLLFFGGPYSNLQATEAFFEQARRLDISAERIICTGDVVAYCGEPQETVDLIRGRGIHVIKGNCEESLGNDMDNCGCGFEQGSNCDLLSASWYAFSRKNLNMESKRWMRDLPNFISFSFAGKKCLVVHGAYSGISKFLFPGTDKKSFLSEFEASQADIVIAGHCGVPFTKFMGERVWHNPGVIGMPANDGTPRMWFSMMSSCTNGIRFEQFSYAYNYQAAAANMRRQDLPESYAKSLENGIWPDHSVMPDVDKRATGIALTAQALSASIQI